MCHYLSPKISVPGTPSSICDVAAISSWWQTDCPINMSSSVLLCLATSLYITYVERWGLTVHYDQFLLYQSIWVKFQDSSITIWYIGQFPRLIQGWKMGKFKSSTFQVFQHLYEPCKAQYTVIFFLSSVVTIVYIMHDIIINWVGSDWTV